MRKKLKAINSDLAIKKLLNILDPYNDNEKMLMINNSIVNSWFKPGLFPIKHGNSKQSQKEQVMNDIDAALRRNERYLQRPSAFCKEQICCRLQRKCRKKP